MREYDVLIIGGGPGGYSLAINAARNGLKTALFEKEHLGGTCLNIGCIPTKCLVDKAAALEKIRSLSEKEILRDGGSFSFRKIQKEKQAVADKLVSGVGFLLKKHGVDVIARESVLEPERVVRSGEECFHGRWVVIATGSRPAALPVPGRELCLDSTGALALTALPDSMVIVGGGVIGLELACVFASFGTAVTVLEMMDVLLPAEQPQAAKVVVRAMQKRGICLLTGARLQKVEKLRDDRLQAVYEKDGAQHVAEGEQVLMAAGRRSNLTGIDADTLGLCLDSKKCIKTDHRQRTNLPGVYAIGDVAGGYQLAHAAYAEGETALADMLGERIEETAPPVPVCTYTIPCLASVGLTTKNAKEAGYDPVLGSFDYGANGMALAEGASGSVFMIMDRQSHRTLGASIVGENASEMIAFASSAVAAGTTVEQWERTIVAHPSLCEMVREAALDAFGRSVHKV